MENEAFEGTVESNIGKGIIHGTEEAHMEEIYGSSSTIRYDDMSTNNSDQSGRSVQVGLCH